MIPAANSSSKFRASLRREAKTHIPVKTIAIVFLISVIGSGICSCGGRGSTPPASGSSSTNPGGNNNRGGLGPRSVAVDPTGKFAYVANLGHSLPSSGSISMYAIDATTGALTSMGPIAAGSDPVFVTVDPTGKFVYAVDINGVLMYTVNATTGALTSTGTVATGLQPLMIAVDRSSKFAYVANAGPSVSDPSMPGNISMYTINAETGALTSIGTVAAELNPQSVAVHPSGKFAYVGDVEGGDVLTYTLNATTGILTSVGAARGSLASVAIDPSGKFAYGADYSDLLMYTIDAITGALTSMGPIAAGSGPAYVTVDPTGKFVYVASVYSNSVSVYAIDATTGNLASTGTIAAESYPTSIAIHPSGKFAYVTNCSGSA